MDFGTCGLGKWGAQQLMKMRGGKKWLVTYTAHYTSYMCSIEFKWCDGKGYAARPINQCTGRSSAEVVSLVRDKSQNPNWKLDLIMFFVGSLGCCCWLCCRRDEGLKHD